MNQNPQANTSSMSIQPALKRVSSDQGPRVDISHKIRGNMLREQDWSTSAGQALQLMRQASSLPVVQMVGDVVVHRPQHQDPGLGYFGWHRARDEPMNDQILDNPGIAVDLGREDIQSVSDSIEQALANDGRRDKPIVNLPPPAPHRSNDPRSSWMPSTKTKQRLYASAEAFLDQKWVPHKGTPREGTYWRGNGEWRCVSSRILKDRILADGA